MKRSHCKVLAGALFVFGSLLTSVEAASVAWWRFDDSMESGILANSGTGGVAYDAVRKGAASFSSNISGPYINDGNGDYYSNATSYLNGGASDSLGSPLSLSATTGMANIFSGSFTLEALVYFTGAPLFSGILSDNTTFGFSTESGNRLRLYAQSSEGTFYQATGTTALGTNQWYSLAAVGTWDGTKTSLQIYINGVAEGASVDITGGIVLNPALPFFIGGTNSLPGYLDELRLSDEALDPAQFLSASAVPEPATNALLLLGAVCVTVTVLNRRNTVEA